MYSHLSRVSNRQAYSHLEEVCKSTDQKTPYCHQQPCVYKFVRDELVKILKGSNLFLEVLKGHIRSYVEANGIVDAHGTKSKQPINSCAGDEFAVAEEEK